MTAMDEIRAHLEEHDGIGEDVTDELVARAYTEAGRPPLRPDHPGIYLVRCAELHYAGKLKVVCTEHIDRSVDWSVGTIMKNVGTRAVWGLDAVDFRGAE